MEFGKIEKVVLIYLGLEMTKSPNLIKRTKITTDIKKILNRDNDKNFPIVLNNSLTRLLKDKDLIFRRYSKVGINKKGKEVAHELFQQIKKEHGGKIKNWKQILESI